MDDAAAPIYANRQELSIRGKRDSFTKRDLLKVGKRQDISNCAHLYAEVAESLPSFPKLASETGIDTRLAGDISNTLTITL